MKAMILEQTVNLLDNQQPLKLADIPIPAPKPGEILIKVTACGVCHTELDEIEGRTPPPAFPMVLGHQVVGQVVENNGGKRLQAGERVGVAWIFSACGACDHCLAGEENLCEDFKATGRDANGGYAEYLCVPEAFAYPIPEIFSDIQAAPHLCAGAIGYRSLRLTDIQDGQSLGLTGFGASAHLVLKLVRYRFPNTKVFVFSRSKSEQEFARDLGAVWSGDIGERSPQKLDCIIDTTPVWKPVVEALEDLAPGGRLVINAIRKESIDQDYLLKLDYPSHLWMEKEIKSVANVTRQDVIEYLDIAAKIPILPEVQTYALEQANLALMELKTRKIRGAKVLVME
ncbi:MAG TPA: zinc-dependent alcohol dehydrogenase family protein [Anaerolineales bacterium]|nr:zinc-dependent alcohol dehydrogenase family protein [Anaerolineales bacterium]